MSIISLENGIDKEKVIATSVSLIQELLQEDPKDEREAENAMWKCLLELGRVLLTALLARRCWRATMDELGNRGLTTEDVSFRMEPTYWAVLNTTIGPMVVPWFTYRHKRGARATRTASRSVMPLHPRCRSTTLLLRWSALLGNHAVFQTAESLLSTLTQGAVRLEDTTISSHCRVIGGLVDRSLLYLSPEALEEQLQNHATRDRETGKPLLNVSTDAYNGQYYVGDTWESKYRNTHAIRLWYVDKKSGRGVTVGGEFIVGTCEQVEAAFDDLVRRGILSASGEYGEVQAQLVFVADGMPWFKERIVARFQGVITVLDNQHVLKRMADTLKSIYRKNSRQIQVLYQQLSRHVTGRIPSQRKPAAKRSTGRGSRPRRPREEVHQSKSRSYPAWDEATTLDWGLPSHSGGAFVAEVEKLPIPKTKKLLSGLIDYLMERLDDVRYQEFWERGITISSAPIESFHRIAQVRLKLPGQTWTTEMAQSILNLRVLNYLGREAEFWSQPDIVEQLVKGFESKAANNRSRDAVTVQVKKKTRVTQSKISRISEMMGGCAA